jgi:hypothetical protein
LKIKKILINISAAFVFKILKITKCTKLAMPISLEYMVGFKNITDLKHIYQKTGI